MTALNAAILFNNSTGSDTQSSGSSAGANVYGSGASTTSASAVVTGITTTGVQAGDLLWVQSSSGRQFSVIASVDSGTQVTCDDTFDNTESSRTWAIGGKRATFDNADSRRVFADDAVTSATIETETNQTINSKLVIGGAGTTSDLFTVKGSTGSEVITQTANTYTLGTGGYSEGFGGDYISVEDLIFENTNASKTSAIVIESSAPVTYARNLKAISSSNNHSTFLSRIAGGTSFIFDSCSIKNCTGTGLNLDRFGNNGVSCLYCDISDNGSYGLWTNRDLNMIHGCIFANNSNSGVYANVGSYSNCIFYNNGGSGVRTYYITNIVGCICYGNTSYGIENNNTQKTYIYKDNAFGSNGSGDIQSAIPFEDNSITLTADPFVDPTASPPDFNLNADSGGGATLRANNFSLNTDTAVYPFRQYVSDDFGSGGGGNVIVIED